MAAIRIHFKILVSIWMLVSCIVGTTSAGDKAVISSIDPFFLSDHLRSFKQRNGTDHLDLNEDSRIFEMQEFEGKAPEFAACDTDYKTKSLFLYDYSTFTIYRVEDFTETFSGSMSLSAFHSGTTGSFRYSRLALDWRSSNLYWVDYGHRWIAMQALDTTNKTMWAVVVQDNTDIPSDLALDPEKNFLFWLDNGEPSRIHRSTLSGHGAEIISHQNMDFAHGLHVDTKEQRLYWTNPSTHRIQYCDYDGSNRGVFWQDLNGFATLTDLIVFENDIISIVSWGRIVVFNKTDGNATELSEVDDFHYYSSLCEWNPEHIPPANAPCDSKGCEHLCINELAEAVCLCMEGYNLNSDNKTCEVDRSIHSRGVALTDGTDLCIMDIRMFSIAGFEPQCFFSTSSLDSLPNTTADTIVRFVPATHERQYYVAMASGKIISVSYTGATTGLNDSTGANVTGLALDWNARNLYWTENKTNSIWVQSLSTLKTERFLTGLGAPRDIIVLPHEQKLVWVSFDDGRSKIEMINLNGTDRQDIVSHQFDYLPMSLGYHSADRMIYYAEGGNIMRVSLEDSGEPRPYFNLFDDTTIAFVYKSFAMEISGGENITYFVLAIASYYEVSGNIFGIGPILDAKIVDPLEQPLELGKCDVLNGGCDQICLPSGSDRRCDCASGYTLQSDQQSCLSETVESNFVLLVDSTFHDIYQIDLANKSNVQGVYTSSGTYPRDCAYDPNTKSVIWNSYYQKIMISSLDGKNETLLLETTEFIRRIAFDPGSRLIYYTEGLSRINAVNLAREVKLILSGLNSVDDLVLDPKEGLLFYVDNDGLTRCNMDGSQRETLRDSIYYPVAMTIDYDERMVYWVDFLGDIERCGYDGSNYDLVEAFDSTFLDIAIDQGYLYYTTTAGRNVRGFNTANVTDTVAFPEVLDFGDLRAMSFYTSTELRVHSICSQNNGGCEDNKMCIPKADINNTAQWVCTCPDIRENLCPGVPGGKGLITTHDARSSGFDLQTFVRTDQESFLDLQARPPNSYSLKSDPAIFACDSDFANNAVFAHDYWTNTLLRIDNFTINFERHTNTSLFHAGVLGDVDSSKIAVDYMSHNVYWSDFAHQWIVVQPATTSDSSMYNVVVRSKNPSEVVVDPEEGYLFWLEESRKKESGTHTAHLMRSTLTGANITTLHYNNLDDADGLTIDVKGKKVYWVGYDRQSIEFSNYEGTMRGYFLRHIGHTFKDLIIIDNNLVVVSATSSSQVITVYDIASTKKLSEYEGQNVLSMCHWNNNLKPADGQDTCNIGCAHICVNQKGIGPTCLCKEGYELAADMKSCNKGKDVFHQAALLNTGTQLCRIDIRFFGHQSYVPVCFYDVSNSASIINPADQDKAWIVDFDVDANNGDIYIAKNTGKIVAVSYLSPNTTREVEDTADGITGVGWDWIGNLLYWSENSTGSISTLDTQTMKSTKIINSITNPQNLLVLPHEGKLLWISGVDGSYNIESAKLDGSDRKIVIDSTHLYKPYSLGYWPQERWLYWLNSTSYQTSLVNGSNIKRVATINFPVTFASTYKNFATLSIEPNGGNFTFYVYDAAKLNSPTLISYVSHKMDKVYGMRFMDSNEQQKTADPCVFDNGGCESICIPDGGQKRCVCQFGYSLAADGVSCDTSLYKDDFILLIDRAYKEILQYSLTNMTIHAVPLGAQADPYGVVYEPETHSIIWSSWEEEAIKMTSLNGDGETTLLDLGYLTYPYRIAIDYTTNSIYFIELDDWFWYYVVSIKMVNFAGEERVVIEDLDDPEDLVIDAERGILFYTESGGSYPHVGRTTMDGKDLKILFTVDNPVSRLHGLAVDYKDKFVYWSDSYDTNMIARCDYDGANYQVVVKGVETDYVTDVDFDGDYIYYTAYHEMYITKINKNNFNDVTKVAQYAELSKLWTITVYRSSSVKRNAFCGDARGDCSSFCLPTSETTGTCACAEYVNPEIDDSTECELVSTCPSRFGNAKIVSTCLRRDGEQCHIECDPAYKPKAGIPAAGVTCYDTAWDIPEPCEEILCPTVLDGTKAYVTPVQCTLKVGVTCQYSCQARYKPTANVTITCQQDGYNGYWNKSANKELCEKIECNDIVVKNENANVSDSCSTSYVGDNCTNYQCYPGYRKHTGSLGVQCAQMETQGYWKKILETKNLCDRILCPTSVESHHATIGQSCLSVYVGDTCGTYQCDHGYRANYGEVVTCTQRNDEGYWMKTSTSDKNLCDAIVCPDRVEGFNGNVTQACTGSLVDATCSSFVCDHGYKANAGVTVTCTQRFAEGYWQKTSMSDKDPCERIICPEIIEGENANINSICTSRYVGSTCGNYACYSGYTRNYGPRVECTQRNEDGYWRRMGTSTDPLCKEVLCHSDAINGENAKVSASCSQSNVGHSCTSYQCNPGYKPTDPVVSLTCTQYQSEAYWEKTTASDTNLCERIVCPEIIESQNANLSSQCLDRYVGDSCARFDCYPGYKPNIGLAVLCTQRDSEGFWNQTLNPNIKLCEDIICPGLIESEKANVSSSCSDRKIGNKCTKFECHPGYQGNADVEVTCIQRGTEGFWSKTSNSQQSFCQLIPAVVDSQTGAEVGIAAGAGSVGVLLIVVVVVIIVIFMRRRRKRRADDDKMNLPDHMSSRSSSYKGSRRSSRGSLSSYVPSMAGEGFYAVPADNMSVHYAAQNQMAGQSEISFGKAVHGRWNYYWQ